MVKPNAPLQIRLTEPVIFLRGSSTGADFRGRPEAARDGQPAMIRGLLTMRLSKPTRIRSIEIKVEGRSRTEWPEGIGSRRTETYEDHVILSETTTYFSAQESNESRSRARRSRSADPGALAQYDIDSEYDNSRFGIDPARLEAELNQRGRQLPRSTSQQGWHYNDGNLGRHPSGEHASRTDSSSDLVGQRFSEPVTRQDSYVSLGNLRIQDSPTPHLGTSPSNPPAYAPSAPNTPSRPTSLRGDSTSDQPWQASVLAEEPITEDVEWEPATPSWNMSRMSSAQVPNSTSHRPSSVHFQPQDSGSANDSTTSLPTGRLAASLQQAMASASHRPSGEPSDVYHPVATGALTVPPTPMMMSPAGSRRNSDELVRPSDLPIAARRAVNGRLPSEMPESILTSRGSSTQLSSSRDASSTRDFSEPSTPSIVSFHTDDHRGRDQHKHKWSLGSAFRTFSADVKDHIRATSHHGSRPSSRASSREPPRSRDGADDHLHHPGMHGRQATDPEWIRGGRSRSRPSSRPGSRATSPAADESRGRSRQRTKMHMFHVGGAKEDSDDEEIHNWTEFRKGVYNYPISFPIPSSAPPTIHTEFGIVHYKLKATVVRAGALTSNLYEEMEVNMIAGPQEDDLEESDNVIVERQWEDQMRYQIALSGKAFPIGGVLPISIRLMPLAKCKIYRLTIGLEEKTDYYAANRKVVRHETPRRFILFAARNPDTKKDRPEPLLPILSESADAAKESPLAELARNAALNNPREFAELTNPEDDVYASLLDPLGPWHLEKDLTIPDCMSRMKFTTKHENTNISIAHWLKVTIRVERGDDKAMDAKGRRKQFDIIIETPVKILDCRVNTQYNSLPSYDRVNLEQAQPPPSCSLHGKFGQVPVNHGPRHVSSGTGSGERTPVANVRALPVVTLSPHPSTANLVALAGLQHNGHASGHTSGTASPHSNAFPQIPLQAHSNKHDDHEDTLLERNIVYDRLMSGQETETGEEPPSYGQAVANAIRSASRAASRSHSHSRGVSATRRGGDRHTPSPSPLDHQPLSRPSSRSRGRMYVEE